MVPFLISSVSDHLHLSLTFTSNPLRVIAHCDVDAAYAAFEAKRLGVNPFEQPLAVQQWNGLVSWNHLRRQPSDSRAEFPSLFTSSDRDLLCGEEVRNH